MPHSARTSLRALPLLALALLAACVERHDPYADWRPVPGFERAPLYLADDAGPRPERRVYRTLDVPPELAPWYVVPAEVPQRVRERDGRLALELIGPKARAVHVPGPFDPHEFNRAVVQVYAPAGESLRVGMYYGDELAAKSPEKALSKSFELQTLVLDLPYVRRCTEPFDELRVELGGRHAGARLVQIQLEWIPPAEHFPEAETGTGLITIGEIARSGVMLSSERPLEAELDWRPGLTFAVHLGQPEEVRRGSEDPIVRLSLSDGRWKVERRVRIGALYDEPATWRRFELDLDVFRRGPVTARFELLVANEGTGWCAVGTPEVWTADPDAPSVLMVTSDTHRADHVGAAHAGIELHTPVLDALAERGVLFEDVQSSTNVTTPSHVALMTATSPRDTGVVTNVQRISRQAETLAEAFADNGWATVAAVSVLHLGPHGSGLGQGFDRMAAPLVNYFSADHTIDLLDPFLHESRGRPLFVWLHLFDAHVPYDPPAEFRALVPPPSDGAGPLDPERLMALYRGEVGFLDHELLRVVGRKRFRDGVIAVTADHGETLAERQGIAFSHSELYPDNLRVPLILCGPGVPEGVRVPWPVDQLGLGRTLLDLAGLEDAAFPGRSLMADVELAAAGEAGRGAPHFALSAHATSASVTWDGWHLVLHLRRHWDDLPVPREEHEVELFHVATDPDYSDDVVDREPARAAEGRALLVAWLLQARPTGWVEQGDASTAVLDQLELLGYLTGGDEERGPALFDPDCECEWCQRFR